MPYPLLWARYSAFILLYPVGVASEMTMVYLAMPTIKKNRPLSIAMPNAWNFALDYYVGCWLGVACYVPGLPELYMHMVKQRKKVLAPASASAGAGPSGSGRGKAKAT
jgi:very-long-chain (3R)-3-hydroxyacyl-CoA dehydratase